MVKRKEAIMNKNLIALKLMHRIYNNPKNLPELHQQVLNGDPFTRFDDNCGVDIVIVKNEFRSFGASISTDDTPISWAALPAILAIGLDGNCYYGRLNPIINTAEKGSRRNRRSYLDIDLDDATTCAILIDDLTDEPDITVYMAMNADWNEAMKFNPSSALYQEFSKRCESDNYRRKVMKIGLIDDDHYTLRNYNSFQSMITGANAFKNDGYIPLIMVEAVDDDREVEVIYWMAKPSEKLGLYSFDESDNDEAEEHQKFEIGNEGYNGDPRFDLDYDDDDDEEDDDDDDD